MGATNIMGKLSAGVGESTQAVLTGTEIQNFVLSFTKSDDIAEFDNVLVEKLTGIDSNAAIYSSDTSMTMSARTHVESNELGILISTMFPQPVNITINGSAINSKGNAINTLSSNGGGVIYITTTGAKIKSDSNGAGLIGPTVYVMHGGSITGTGIVADSSGAGIILTPGATLSADQSASIAGEGALGGGWKFPMTFLWQMARRLHL